MKDSNRLSHGWAAIITGHELDLEYWERSLNHPFDPWVEKITNESPPIYILRSASLNTLSQAEEVKARAETLIAQLNGAQAVIGGAESVRFDGALRIDADGNTHRTVFAELFEQLRASAMFTASVINADGTPARPSPPQPSNSQKWLAAADTNDDIADMLAFVGRRQSWYDIYKAYELAGRLAGGLHRLPKLLGSSAKVCEDMRVTANYYRHARGHRPARLTTIEEAHPLIAFVIRSVLDHVLPS